MKMQFKAWMQSSLLATGILFASGFASYASAADSIDVCENALERSEEDGSDGNILCDTLVEAHEDTINLGQCIECMNREMEELDGEPVDPAPSSKGSGMETTRAGAGVLGASAAAGIAAATFGAPLALAGAIGLVGGGAAYALVVWML